MCGTAPKADSLSPAPDPELGRPLRIAYVVARFPKTTETFVVRELNYVAAHAEIDARLLALFRPQATQRLVHPSAQKWVDEVSRPSWRAGTLAFTRWLARRPLVTLSTLALLLGGFRRKPRLAVKSLASMLIACAHAENLQAEQVDHIHAHFLGNTTTVAWVIQRLTGIPYSATAHAYDLFIDQDFLVRRVRDAEFVVAISAFNKEFISRLCSGLPTPPVHIVHAGINLPDFPFHPRSLPRTGKLNALAVGSLIERKGHHLLIQALAQDDPQLNRLHLSIVGEGERRPVLEELIRRHGLEQRVTLLGAQAEDRVADLMQQADVFILPSTVAATGSMEGIPVVLMEALASGVPVVATKLSGIPELVEDGITGTLTEPECVTCLRQALLSVLVDSERAAKLAAQGRRRVEDEFDVERTAGTLAQLMLAAHGHG